MINRRLNILHLSRRLDREKSFMEEMRKQGASYSVVEAIDNPKNVKLAISQGHKKIIQEAKTEGLPNVIIAEDDIKFFDEGAYDYFLSQIPDSYDLFCGLIYSGEVGENNRILNGMSGTQTLYSVHSRFYDFILSQPDNVHIDRNLGQYAHQYEYFVCAPFVCYQSGGYSDNLKREMWYDAYLEGKSVYCKK